MGACLWSNSNVLPLCTCPHMSVATSIVWELKKNFIVDKFKNMEFMSNEESCIQIPVIYVSIKKPHTAQREREFILISFDLWRRPDQNDVNV